MTWRRRNERAFLRKAINTSPIAIERGVETRPYQLDLAVQTIRALQVGRSVGIALPTGSGKTMVADLVTRLWIDRYPDQTVLSVVPRRVLVDQHRRHARWLVPPLHVTGLHSGERRDLNRRLRDNQLVVTTPRLLGNAIRNDKVDERFLRSIALVVIDEVDAMLTTSWSEDGVDATLHDSLRILLQGLGRVRFLLLTATPPEATTTNSPPERRAQADAIAREFRVRTWKRPTERAIRRFIPRALVVWSYVVDGVVSALDRAIENELTIIFDLIDDATSGRADREYFRTRHREIASGSVKSYRTKGGTRLPVSDELRQLCSQLVRRYGQRLFLYEDDMHGYATYETFYRQRLITRLAEPVDQDRYRAELRGKISALLEILNAHSDNSGLVFVRYLEVAEAVLQALGDAQRSVRILHGQLDDRQRSQAREWFRNSENGVLVLTRATGSRGLDIPEADFAVFYSPKSNIDTLWQEMSRIRATVDRLKPSYILVYDLTSEASKAAVTSTQMDHEPARFDQRVIPSV